MVTTAKSTSVTLLYVERPILNFARYVDNLDRVLRETGHERFDLHWNNEDFVTFDLDGSRVVLGYADLDPPSRAPGEPSAGYKAALVLAVGPSPRQDASRAIADNGRALCDSVIERIQKRHGADLILWTEVEGVFTLGHFDTLIDTALTMRPARALPAALSRFDDPQVDRLMDRLQDEVGPLEPATPQAAPELALLEEPAPADEAPANDLPELPHPMREEMARIREALYPPEPPVKVVRDKEPMVRRLTIYTFNTTLLMVSLPVGAALLTYNVLGREDSRLTARLMALTGIGVAFSKAVFHGHLPHLGA